MDSQEAARISAVKALGILDTEPEQVFDDAVSLAAAICGTPVGLVTFLDGERQWFKAKVGTEVCEVPQDITFCVHTIRQKDLFMIPDATQDHRFEANPMVTNEPNIRFYAGMPLLDRGGHAIGTLCVLDVVPRMLTPEQQRAMSLLSRQVATQVDLRSKMIGLREELVQKTLLEEQITDANALFRAFMDNSPIAGFIKNEQGQLIYYNRLFADRFAITRDEWIGKDDFDIWSPDLAAQLQSEDLTVLEDGRLLVSEESSCAPDGSCIHWMTYKFPFVNPGGARFLAAVSLNVSTQKKAELELKRSHEELHRANERLRELSVTDALTGLWNRRGFDERLHQCLATASRSRASFSLLLLDVDNFKSFNDTFGHDRGDLVLRCVADLLQQGARSSDAVCRYGGEEFAVLLPATGIVVAMAMAERIRRSIEEGQWVDRQVTVSIGVFTVPPNMRDPSDAVRKADLALYEAKALGKNRVAVYHPALEAELKHAG